MTMTTLAKPAMRPARPEFSSGPCAKRPGWTPDNLQDRDPRALAPLEGRQGAPAGRHRPDPRRAASSGRLPDRHRPRLRHRRGRDGPVVDARPPPGAAAGLRMLRQGLGHRRRQTAEDRRRGARRALWPVAGPDQGPPRRRPGVHLERHHLGRARAQRRLHRRRPRGRDHLRRHQRLLRPGPRLAPSSMSSPSPGRRPWAARRRMASSSSRPAPWPAWKAIRRHGRCPSCSA